MLVRVDRTIEARSSLSHLLAWIRNPESRRCWPGAAAVLAPQETVFYYQASLTDNGDGPSASIEEHLRTTEELVDGFRVESAFLLRWLRSDELVTGWATYQASVSGTRRLLAFSFRYLVPGNRAERLLAQQGFRPAIETSVDRYLSCLVATALASASTWTRPS